MHTNMTNHGSVNGSSISPQVETFRTPRIHALRSINGQERRIVDYSMVHQSVRKTLQQILSFLLFGLFLRHDTPKIRTFIQSQPIKQVRIYPSQFFLNQSIKPRKKEKKEADQTQPPKRKIFHQFQLRNRKWNSSLGMWNFTRGFLSSIRSINFSQIFHSLVINKTQQF